MNPHNVTLKPIKAGASRCWNCSSAIARTDEDLPECATCKVEILQKTAHTAEKFYKDGFKGVLLSLLMFAAGILLWGVTGPYFSMPISAGIPTFSIVLIFVTVALLILPLPVVSISIHLIVENRNWRNKRSAYLSELECLKKSM